MHAGASEVIAPGSVAAKGRSAASRPWNIAADTASTIWRNVYHGGGGVPLWDGMVGKEVFLLISPPFFFTVWIYVFCCFCMCVFFLFWFVLVFFLGGVVCLFFWGHHLHNWTVPWWFQSLRRWSYTWMRAVGVSDVAQGSVNSIGDAAWWC